MNSLLYKMQQELISYSVLEGKSTEVDGVIYPTFCVIDKTGTRALNLVYMPPMDKQYFEAVCRMVRSTFEKMEEKDSSLGDPQGARDEG